jgi:hypothetical protein
MSNKFVYMFSEADKSMKNLLGGKNGKTRRIKQKIT